MHRTVEYSRLLARPFLTAARGFCTSLSKSGGEKIVASVLFERLPVVIPKIDPIVYAFKEFSFRWQQQYRKEYPDTFLQKSNARGQGDHHIEYTPAPRITEADKTNDKNRIGQILSAESRSSSLVLLQMNLVFTSPSIISEMKIILPCSHCREHLTEDSIFFCMVLHMILIEHLCGTFPRRFTTLNQHYASVRNLL